MKEYVKRYIIPIIYCLLLAFLCLWIFSFATSPRYGITHYGDPAIFQLIGKAWSEGHLPYVDYWDLKGPIIFFVNAIGYSLTSSVTGVFFIEWICLSLTLLICYKILHLNISIFWSFCLLLLIAASYTYSSEGGNSVSEFILPLISLSYYCAYKWLNSLSTKEIDTHPANYALVYGLTFGFALMSRLTDAVGVCGLVAVVGIWLITKRSWKNLGTNILAFLVGILVIVIPFVIYFAAHGALYDMWYGTILYNLDYAGGSGASEEARTLLIYFRDAWLLFVIAVMALLFDVSQKKNKLNALTWCVVAALTLCWLYRSFGFAHYALVCVPLIAVALALAKQTFWGGWNIRFSIKVLPILFIAVFSLYTLRLTVITYHSIGNSIKTSNNAIARCENFMKGTPSSVRESFVAYNTSPAYYLTAGILPADRFFTYQDWNASRSPSLKRYLHEDFARKRIKWILVDGNAVEIAGMLHQYYHVYKKDNTGLVLYERNSLNTANWCLPSVQRERF